MLGFGNGWHRLWLVGFASQDTNQPGPRYLLSRSGRQSAGMRQSGMALTKGRGLCVGSSQMGFLPKRLGKS